MIMIHDNNQGVTPLAHLRLANLRLAKT